MKYLEESFLSARITTIVVANSTAAISNIFKRVNIKFIKDISYDGINNIKSYSIKLS
jgi:hypothetical protein